VNFDYASLAAIAKDLLKDFGAPVTLQVYDIPAYDPNSGSATPTFTAYTRNAVILDFGAGQTLSTGGLIQGGDKRLILEPGVAPALEDRIVANGVEYVVKGVGEVSPANLPVVYDLHLGNG
jgi:hypothetical protein